VMVVTEVSAVDSGVIDSRSAIPWDHPRITLCRWQI